MDQKPNNNPLAKHFRQPAIYFKLPSEGKFWPEGSLDLPVTGELPIYPMTAADEVTLKTPDALMNGTAIIKVIQSCCPNILKPWEMPSVDVDAILIAIRIASFGQKMGMTATCPHCNKEHDYDADLTQLLGNIKCADYDTPVLYNGLTIKLCPQKYINVTKSNIINFEETKIMTALNDSSIAEDVRNAKLAESMKRIITLNAELLVTATEYIATEDGTKVTDEEFIREFYANAEAQVSRLIEEKLTKVLADSALPPFKLKCTEEECGKTFEIPLEFDYSRFFALGS